MRARYSGIGLACWLPRRTSFVISTFTHSHRIRRVSSLLSLSVLTSLLQGYLSSLHRITVNVAVYSDFQPGLRHGCRSACITTRPIFKLYAFLQSQYLSKRISLSEAISLYLAKKFTLRVIKEWRRQYKHQTLGSELVIYIPRTSATKNSRPFSQRHRSLLSTMPAVLKEIMALTVPLAE